ncbi:DUF3140 domain-containing protein [Streptomyces sp. NPDC008163]|uniref:DUF3140 domain-containing protein n=1 Tax=Streptomyces sp. NPDC008163 TaxID=3364818 RepID=UPI0036EFB0CF
MSGGRNPDRQEILDRFGDAAGMTAGEFEKRLDTDDSRAAGQKGGGGESTGHASGRPGSSSR